MNIKQLFIPALLFLLGFTACETTEKIDDFPLRPSQLVVNCFFAPDSTWEFQVSKSLSVLDNADLKLINNATIKLFRDSEIIDTITVQDDDKWYRTGNNLPEIGKEYSIEVSSPDFGKILLARDIVPQPVPVSNVSIVLTDSSFYEWIDHDGDLCYSGNIKGNFNIKFSDPANIENYYQLSIYYYDTSYYNWEDPSGYYLERRELSISSDDPVVVNSREYGNILLLTDNIFDGQDYLLKVDFEDWDARRDKQYYIEFVSLNRSGYLYRRTVDDFYQSQGDPFAESVQVYCNIENGYGIFSGYSTDIYNVSLK